MEDKEFRERIVKVETKVENIESVALRLEAKLDVFTDHYVQRHELKEMFYSRDEQIKQVRDEIKTLQQEKVAEQLNEKSTGKQLLANWSLVIVTIISVVIAATAIFHK